MNFVIDSYSEKDSFFHIKTRDMGEEIYQQKGLKEDVKHLILLCKQQEIQ